MDIKLLIRTILIFIMTLSVIPIYPKITFTEKLRKKITLNQDKTLDLLVNGRDPDITSLKPVKTQQNEDIKTTLKDIHEPKHNLKKDNQSKSLGHSPNKNHGTVSNSTSPSFYYGQGYRVKIFMGGSTRQDKEAASRFGKAFKNHFPHISVYMHFVSPHWVCTAGDFQTQAEAYGFIKTIRETGVYNTSEMMVVKSRVKIYQN